MKPAPVPVLLMARELDLGGSERQLAEIARALDQEKFAAHAGCFRGQGLRAGELRSLGVPVAVFRVRSLSQPSAVIGAFQFGRYLKRHGIRLVHTFDVPTNLFGVPLARKFQTPVVLSSQRAYRDLAPAFQRRLLRLTDQIADGVVVNCEAMRTHLVVDEGVAAARVHVCPNGIDTGIYFPPRERASGPAPLVGVVCALRPEKGLDTLLRAFASVRSRAPAARLTIVGGGPERGRLESLAGELSLGDCCRFEGATYDVAGRLREIDVFVLPSLSEALSNSLMEAMACACAVVASRVGGNVELAEPERTGLLFQPGDAAGLAAQILRLLGDAELRKRLGENAARRIREEFSLQRAAGRMAAIYERFLSGVDLILDKSP